MTSWNAFSDRNRDQQDGFERGVWGEVEYVDGAGAVMRIRGTGTEDEEAPILNTGFGFNLPKDSNAEVFMVSHGSDTNQKYVIPTIPRDKQRKWAEGAGGIQHPTNGDRAFEINNTDTWLKDGTFIIGDARGIKLTVNGSSGTLEFGGGLTLNCVGACDINSTTLTHNGKNIGDTHTHNGVTPGGGITGVPT